MDSPSTTCLVCDRELGFIWTDTHGVGVCSTCGLPYTIFHYNEKREPEDKPPSVAIKEAYLPLAKRFWEETHSRVFPGAFDMGFLGGRGTTYSGATREECELFENWLRQHEHELPKEEIE